MMTTNLEEAANGWILTVWNGPEKTTSIYVRLIDAQEYRNAIEENYERKGVSHG